MCQTVVIDWTPNTLGKNRTEPLAQNSCSTLSGLFWLSIRHHSGEKEGGQADLPPIPPYYQGDSPVGCTEISLKPLDQNAHLIISYYDDDK